MIGEAEAFARRARVVGDRDAEGFEPPCDREADPAEAEQPDRTAAERKRG